MVIRPLTTLKIIHFNTKPSCRNCWICLYFMLYKVPKAPFLVNVLYLGGRLKIFPRILPIGFSGMYAAEEAQGNFLFLIKQSTQIKRL